MLLLRLLPSPTTALLALLGFAAGQETTETIAAKRFYLPGASGSGPFEAVRDFIAAFEAKYPEADLSVSSVGSGAAQSALWGEVNCEKKPVEGLCSDDVAALATETLWGMGGGTIDSEHYEEHLDRGLQQLPALGGPILVTYSKDLTGDLGASTSRPLNMSFATVAGIFNNTIVKWNDPSIRRDNPGIVFEEDYELPDDRITVVVRSDKSGMSQTFTEAIKHSNPSWPEEGVGKTPEWPLVNLTHSSESAVERSQCEVAAVVDDSSMKSTNFEALNYKADGQTGIGISLLRRPFSVGYLELGYFSSLQQFVAQAHISSPAHPNMFVPATVETLKTTMGGLADRLEPETLSLTLVDQDTPPGGYPISRYVYWYAKKDAREYQNCYQAWLVYKFIHWTYTDPLAEEIANTHGWVVPPEPVVNKALEKLNEMQCFDDENEEGQQPMFTKDYVPPPYREEEEDDSNLTAILVPTLVAAFCLIAAIGGYAYVGHKQKASDAVWQVQMSELDFGPQKTVIGKGSFGVVLLAEYRGTKVAVKKVIPSPTPNIDHGETVWKLNSKDTNSAAHTDTLGNKAYFASGLNVSSKGLENSTTSAKGLETSTKELKSLSLKRGSEFDTVTEVDLETAFPKEHNPGLKSMGAHKTLQSVVSAKTASKVSTYRHRKRQHEKMKQDFVMEMRQLAKLRHPNITTVMGAVLSRQEPMLVMEYMQNGSLYDAIRNDTLNLTSKEDILTIVQDVASGLRFLHSANPQVLHGDLKAKNVLIDSNFRAKVADFGLSAKAQDGARGTPYWMAPELLLETSTGTAMSDVYAFGILIYEVYSRKNPYEGENYDEVLPKICDPAQCYRPPVPTLCPSNVARMMKDCLQHNPRDRPTMKEIDSVLQAEGTVQGRVFRIEALNRDLLKSNEEITTEQSTQLEHFASMSHEIRTPLNCIVGVSSLLEDNENLDAVQKDSVKMIVSSSTLLKQVVDDVLDFSKFLSGKAEIDIQHTDLQEVLSNIVNSMVMSPVAERKEISLRTFYGPSTPQYVETDGRRLQQIMYNLFSNAIKFSKQDGNVDFSVSVEYDRHSFTTRGGHIAESPKLCLYVTDYGKGIDASQYEKIFQPFAQTKDGSQNVDGGTGLGLAITKQLTELLGGSIAVNSKMGEWTRFSLKFPLNSPPVDGNSMKMKLANCVVCLVGNSDENTRHVVNAQKYFNFQMKEFETMSTLTKALGSPKGDRTFVCIVAEDLYDDAIYQALSKQLKMVLVTFGPNGNVDKGQPHYNSLTRIFPSVLVQDFASLCDYANLKQRLDPGKNEKKEEVRFDGLKVLLAEDNKINQKVMKRMLERLGVTEVQVAENGKIATEMEATESFDLILMDIQMPVMDGLEACRIIVARKKENPPPIIFLTAHASDDFKTLCIENGGVGYVTKPCSLGDIRTALQNLVVE